MWMAAVGWDRRLRARKEISGAIRRPDVEPISRREERA